MKNYQKIILVMSLIISPLAEIKAACKTAPDCASLGYTEDASNCSGSFLKCPWDLNKASCTTCKIENCAKCKASNPSECETCADGYSGWPLALVGQETHWTECRKRLIITCRVANCKTCVTGNPEQCKECQSGYSLSVDRTKCINFSTVTCKVANCAECSPFDNNKCMTCMTRYSLTSDGKCKILPNS